MVVDKDQCKIYDPGLFIKKVSTVFIIIDKVQGATVNTMRFRGVGPSSSCKRTVINSKEKTDLLN